MVTGEPQCVHHTALCSTKEDRERIEHAANSLQPPAPVEARSAPSSIHYTGPHLTPRVFAPDEPALLFMGSPAPPTAHVQPRQQVASTEVEDENDDGEDEGDCGAKDKRLPDGLASPPIPPSLDSSSNYATSPGLAHPPVPAGSRHTRAASPLFTITQLGVDCPLVDSKRQLKMYRVWMQGKFHGLPLALERDTGAP